MGNTRKTDRDLLGLIAVSALVFCGLADAQAPQQAGQLDTSPALFSVLAAINAVGYDAELSSTANSPLRQMVRAAIASRKIDSLDDLKHFFDQHKQRNLNAELNQYISFAMIVDGPPAFHYLVPPNEIPPDAAGLGGLELILPKFYREAGLEDLWNKAQPYYDREIEKYHLPISRALLEVNGYLRNATSGYLGRRFQIYIDLLGAPNQVQSRSYKDDYFIVITPSAEPQIDRIRHAYLHYLLDPLAMKYSENLRRKSVMSDYAAPAPALEDAYKDDFILLLTECFIKAVESRLAPAGQRQAIVDQALSEGFVMTPVFAEGLAVYEKQPESMRLYFPDIVEAIDLQKEAKRLDKVQFVSTRAVRTIKTAAPPAAEPSKAEKTLAEAQDLSAKHNAPPADLENAKNLFLRSLQESANSALHAKAYYGLARIAALERDPEMAERLFQKALDLTPDPETKCWSYVYLGRLAQAGGDPERQPEAQKFYRAALAVEAAPDAAKAAAQSGLEQSLKLQNIPQK